MPRILIRPFARPLPILSWRDAPSARRGEEARRADPDRRVTRTELIALFSKELGAAPLRRT